MRLPSDAEAALVAHARKFRPVGGVMRLAAGLDRPGDDPTNDIEIDCRARFLGKACRA